MTFAPRFGLVLMSNSDKSLTTNVGENFHSEFNSNSYHDYPNIFKIIEVIKIF